MQYVYICTIIIFLFYIINFPIILSWRLSEIEIEVFLFSGKPQLQINKIIYNLNWPIVNS